MVPSKMFKPVRQSSHETNNSISTSSINQKLLNRVRTSTVEKAVTNLAGISGVKNLNKNLSAAAKNTSI